MGGKCYEKNSSLFVDSFFPELESTKCEDSVFVHSMSPHVWDSVFFRAEMFGLLKDKIPLVCWSQGSGYSLSVSIGSLYGVRPNQIPPKGKFSQKKTANYPYFVDKGGEGVLKCG